MTLDEYIDTLTTCINSKDCKYVDKMTQIRDWLLELKELRIKIKELRSEL